MKHVKQLSKSKLCFISFLTMFSIDSFAAMLDESVVITGTSKPSTTIDPVDGAIIPNFNYNDLLNANESKPDVAKKNTLKSELQRYTGLPGSAPAHATITSAGVAVEQLPSGVQPYVFFTQTLAVGIFYEGRAYYRNNYVTVTPILPSANGGGVTDTNGYGFAGKLGYNFKVNKGFEMTPYLRLNQYYNMAGAYNDNAGNNISSASFAILPGVKLIFITATNFNPYIDLYGGYQQVSLTGKFNIGNSVYKNMTANYNQISTTTEIGFGYKVSEFIAIIPYWQYVNTSSSPSAQLQASYSSGGFNIADTTQTQQVLGLKLNISW